MLFHLLHGNWSLPLHWSDVLLGRLEDRQGALSYTACLEEASENVKFRAFFWGVLMNKMTIQFTAQLTGSRLTTWPSALPSQPQSAPCSCDGVTDTRVLLSLAFYPTLFSTTPRCFLEGFESKERTAEIKSSATDCLRKRHTERNDNKQDSWISRNKSSEAMRRREDESKVSW